MSSWGESMTKQSELLNEELKGGRGTGRKWAGFLLLLSKSYWWKSLFASSLYEGSTARIFRSTAFAKANRSLGIGSKLEYRGYRRPRVFQAQIFAPLTRRSPLWFRRNWSFFFSFWCSLQRLWEIIWLQRETEIKENAEGGKLCLQGRELSEWEVWVDQEAGHQLC